MLAEFEKYDSSAKVRAGRLNKKKCVEYSTDTITECCQFFKYITISIN